jgi:hypothetical protein
VQTPPPQQAQTSGVRRDVAADLTRALGSEVEREDEALFGEIVVGSLENDAGIGGEDTRDRVE